MQDPPVKRIEIDPTLPRRLSHTMVGEDIEAIVRENNGGAEPPKARKYAKPDRQPRATITNRRARNKYLKQRLAARKKQNTNI